MSLWPAISLTALNKPTGSEGASLRFYSCEFCEAVATKDTIAVTLWDTGPLVIRAHPPGVAQAADRAAEDLLLVGIYLCEGSFKVAGRETLEQLLALRARTLGGCGPGRLFPGGHCREVALELRAFDHQGFGLLIAMAGGVQHDVAEPGVAQQERLVGQQTSPFHFASGNLQNPHAFAGATQPRPGQSCREGNLDERLIEFLRGSFDRSRHQDRNGNRNCARRSIIFWRWPPPGAT